MVDGIGNGSGALGREAIRAAMDAQSRAADRIRAAALDGPGGPGEMAGAEGAVQETSKSFADQLTEGVNAINGEVVRAEQLPSDFIAGKVEDFHEVAMQMKRADIGFRFALEIRNKLIDAYREVMRMNV